MRFRRRDETLNEQLLREAGLAGADEPQVGVAGAAAAADEQPPPAERDAEPGDAESGATEPGAAEPDAAGADATDPDATDPDATDADATDPDATDPDEPDPDDTEPVERRVIEIRPAAVLTAEVLGISADTVDFVALPDGELLAEDDETADEDLSVLADAVEERVQPPYRVHARRAGGDDWEILAYRLDVLTFAYGRADSLRLLREDGETELLADGEPVDDRVPELEAAGEAAGRDYVVQAERLDGDLWEIRAAAV